MAEMEVSPAPSSDIYPIHLLMDELKSEDVHLRLASIRRLSTIALALGPQRTRDELIPFLQDQLDDEDEVLLVLAEELGDFADYVGGPEYAHLVMGPLENLAAVEETLVREKAAESISKMSVLLSPASLEAHFLPLLRRLSTGDWFTSRTSASALYAPAYPKANEEGKKEMRKLFGDLVADDTPMVRRAAAKALAFFVEAIFNTPAPANTTPQKIVIEDIIPLYKRLASDDQDSVRLLTIPDLIAICKGLEPKSEIKPLVGTQLAGSWEDKSWRVKYMLAENFVKLAEAVGQDIVREDLVQAFVQLLGEAEAEVKTAAASQIPGFAVLLDREVILARIIPCVQALSTDQSQHVRSALAKEITGLTPVLGPAATEEYLLPIFLRLLKDEFSEVRLHLISKLEVVNEVIGIQKLSEALLPAIMELALDKQWRVRQAIIEYIPLLATQLGVEFFDEKLGNLCMSWLGDTVFSIREAATVNLKKLTEVFGVDWARSTIVPQVLAMGSHPNYLYRMTTVFAITTITPSLDLTTLRDSVVDAALALAQDPIPNIRFNVAKALEVLATTLQTSEEGSQIVQSKIVPALEKLQQDSDADVRYFATKALERTQLSGGAEPMVVS